MSDEAGAFMRFIWHRLAFSVVVLLVSFYALAGNADFRRRAHQSIDIETINKGDVEAEIRFGRSVAARILGRFKLSPDQSLQHYVELVGQTLARNASRSELEFHFGAVQSEAVNAYSTPGGYVFVTTGAIDLMQDEAELAGVLAHEIAHVTRRHIVKELGIRGTDESATSGLARIMGGGNEAIKAAFAQSVDKAVAVLFESGFKKEEEIDADSRAVMLLAFTGYDPKALSRYIQRTSKHLKSATQEHVSHPPTPQRISRLDAFLRNNDLRESDFPAMQERFSQYVHNQD